MPGNATFADRSLTVHGQRFHLTDWGPADAPTVLFLHGVTGHARTWDHEAAGERGCLVIPGARVARDTVEEENRRGIGGAPVGQVKALAVHRQGPIGERRVPRHPSRILQELDTIRPMAHAHRETAAHRSRRHLLVVLVLT